MLVVISTMTKSNLGEEWVYLLYRAQSTESMGEGETKVGRI